MINVKMEIITSKDYAKNSEKANIEISTAKNVEMSNGDISFSSNAPASENLNDGLSLSMSAFSSFPLLKKKKKKVLFAQYSSKDQEKENLKNPELQSFTQFRHEQNPLNLDCELKSIQLENKENENIISKTSSESQISEHFSQISLNASKELDDLDIDMNFEGAKKKKKKSKQTLSPADDISEKEFSEKKMPVADRIFYSSDSDYTYDYLLARFYRIAKQERPTMESTSVMKLTIKPPLIFRVGSKKTSFANFIEICKVLHRPPQHLMSFLLAELGTSGSLDGNNHLIIKGKFQQKQFENIIRRYIKEYVRCFTCSSLSTVMQKEIRLTFLMCQNCESRRSVTSIKSGFQAVTGKRAAIRAKTVI